MGKYLAYVANGSSRLHVLDLARQDVASIDLNMALPDSIRVVGIYTPLWSPHSEDMLIINCATVTDTGRSWYRAVYGHHACLVDWRSGSVRIIHPPTLPKVGADFTVMAWLPGSLSGHDSLLVYHHYGVPFIHLLETGQDISTPGLFGFLGYSRDGRHLLQWVSPDIYFPHGKLLLDGVEIHIPRPVSIIERVSWSPDGSKVALSVLPDDISHPRTEVWILKVNEYLAGGHETMPMDEINFQRRYCTYNFLGIWPEYTSDSTVVVSMHRDGDEASLLWEISEKDARAPKQLSIP